MHKESPCQTTAAFNHVRRRWRSPPRVATPLLRTSTRPSPSGRCRMRFAASTRKVIRSRNTVSRSTPTARGSPAFTSSPRRPRTTSRGSKSTALRMAGLSAIRCICASAWSRPRKCRHRQSTSLWHAVTTCSRGPVCRSMRRCVSLTKRRLCEDIRCVRTRMRFRRHSTRGCAACRCPDIGSSRIWCPIPTSRTARPSSIRTPTSPIGPASSGCARSNSRRLSTAA